MKPHVRLLTIAVLAVLGCVGFLLAQPTKEPTYSLTITPSRPNFVLGSRIQISIKISNISGDPIAFQFGNYGGQAREFQYDVRDEWGKVVRKISHKDPFKPSRPPGFSLKGSIPPGKSVEEGSVISDIFAFDHTGSYTIRLWHKEPGGPTVTSNEITIYITPK